jgi:hypothetical protein
MITPAEINRRNREHYGQEPGPPTPVPYERRFVAYIDILGWKRACCDPTEYARVSAVAKTLSELPRNFSRDLKDRLQHIKGAVSDSSHQKTEVVTLSDSLVISTPVDVGYMHLFKFLTIVCRRLLTDKFLTRGGVTVGNLYHEENMVFGPALIEAVALEQEEAIYPRILCSRDLVAEIECSQDCEPSDLKVTIIDHLGRSVINLLAFEQGNPAAWPDLVKRTIDTIALDNLPDKELEKWRYMRDVLQMMIQCADQR